MVMSRYSVYLAEKNNSKLFSFLQLILLFFLLIKHLVCVVGLRGTWSESSGIDACHIHLLCPSFLCPMKSSLSIVLSPLQNTKKNAVVISSFCSQQDQRSQDNISIVIADLGYLFKTSIS